LVVSRHQVVFFFNGSSIAKDSTYQGLLCAVLARLKLTLWSPTLAVTTYSPCSELAVAARLATPVSSVMTVRVGGKGKMLGPRKGALKVTATLGAGMPAPSVTVTCSGLAKATPVAALWGFSPVRVRV